MHRTGQQMEDNMKKNIILYLILASSLFSCNPEKKEFATEIKDSIKVTSVSVKKQESDFLQKYPLVSFLRKSTVEVGCIFEQELNYRDSVFNCSNKNYVNNGGPCENTEEYYKGFQIADSIAHKIHPLIKGIDMQFEGGNLREITFNLSDSITKSKAKEVFNLPSDTTHLENITTIMYGENISACDKPVNPEYTKWISIVGFDHQGAGDVECP